MNNGLKTWGILIVVFSVFAGPLATAVLAARGHIAGGAFGATGTGIGEFNEPQGVAVNETNGYVYVVDRGNNRVERFSATGGYETEFNGSGTNSWEVTAAGHGQFASPDYIVVDNSCRLRKLSGTDCSSVDPSNEDVYVFDNGHQAIDKFKPNGEYVNEIHPPSGEVYGISADSQGNVWVDQKSGFRKLADKFTNGTENTLLATVQISAFGEFGPGFAVDSQDNLYIHLNALFPEGNRVAEFNNTGHELNDGIDREPSAAVAVELPNDDPYVDNITTVARFDENGSLMERFGAGHLTHGTGIGVDSATETLYVADSASNQIHVFLPEPPGAPTVEGQSVSQVTASSAEFDAEVNPRGAGSKYQFEYGPCAANCATSEYSESVPSSAEPLGADFEIHLASAHPNDLVPNTVYHFRVVVRNQYGLATGEEHVFTTQSTGGAVTLPDGRAWEMVSPTDKLGAFIDPMGFGLIQAGASGRAFTYPTTAPTEREAEGYAGPLQVVSQRGAGGWSSRDVAPSFAQPTGIQIRSEFPFFSDDLSLGLVNPQVEISPQPLESSELTPYLWQQSRCARLDEARCYLPLITSKQPYADVSSSAAFGGKLRFAAATPDLEHVVVGSEAVNLLEATSADAGNLYEWSRDRQPAERLQLISVLPTGSPVGPTEGGVANVGALANGFFDVRNAISQDGSRAFWMNELGVRHLYMRDTVVKETIQLDIGSPETGPAGAAFQTASVDGASVFFTSTARLTPESSSSGSDLYECEVVVEGGKLKCHLNDLTPEAAGEPSEVEGVIPGASEDGRYVYAVAKGVLTNEPNAMKEKAQAKGHNLYLMHRTFEGRWATPVFIASLSNADEADWAKGVVANIQAVSARVAPNGRFITFMSNRPLTGYDTRDANSGKPDEEVYLYDSQTNKLICASCNPTGAQPVGVEKRFGDINLARTSVGDGTWFASTVPAWSDEGTYQARYLTDNGRLFFDTTDALVPQDVNNAMDVYEFEPVGVGDCSSSAPTFHSELGGCVALISSGTGQQGSAFLDASQTGTRDGEGGEGGGDVFFLTAVSLTPQDTDTAFDVYDAHECTAASPCFEPPAVSPPPCATADACRLAPTQLPGSLATPASATFSGAGNVVSGGGAASAHKAKPLTRAGKLARTLRRCRKRRGKRQRMACERRAQRLYGKRVRARAGRNVSRRAGR